MHFSSIELNPEPVTKGEKIKNLKAGAKSSEFKKIIHDIENEIDDYLKTYEENPIQKRKSKEFTGSFCASKYTDSDIAEHFVIKDFIERHKNEDLNLKWGVGSYGDLKEENYNERGNIKTHILTIQIAV